MILHFEYIQLCRYSPDMRKQVQSVATANAENRSVKKEIPSNAIQKSSRYILPSIKVPLVTGVI